MRIVALSAMMSSLLCFAGPAYAQQDARLFFEGDMVRGDQEGAPGRSACSTTSSSIWRRWSGACASSTRPASRSMTRASRASSSNCPTVRSCRRDSARIRHRARPAHGSFLDGPLDHSDRLPERHVRLQGRRHRSGRQDAHLGAVQARHLAAAGARGRHRNQESDQGLPHALFSSRPARMLARARLRLARARCVRSSWPRFGAAAAAARPSSGPEVPLTEPAGGFVGRAQRHARARPGRHADHGDRARASPPSRSSSSSGAP